MVNIQSQELNSRPCTLERKSPVSLIELLVLRTNGCRIISSNIEIFSVGQLTLETIGLPGGGILFLCIFGSIWKWHIEWKGDKLCISGFD